MATPAPAPHAPQLLRLIEAATREARSDIVVWRSEWSGYLPFGASCWLECGGQEISREFPAGWSEDDLLALEADGALVRLDDHVDPDDEFERRISYRVVRPAPDPLSGS